MVLSVLHWLAFVSQTLFKMQKMRGQIWSSLFLLGLLRGGKKHSQFYYYAYHYVYFVCISIQNRLEFWTRKFSHYSFKLLCCFFLCGFLAHIINLFDLHWRLSMGAIFMIQNHLFEKSSKRLQPFWPRNKIKPFKSNKLIKTKRINRVEIKNKKLDLINNKL